MTPILKKWSNYVTLTGLVTGLLRVQGESLGFAKLAESNGQILQQVVLYINR